MLLLVSYGKLYPSEISEYLILHMHFLLRDLNLGLTFTLTSRVNIVNVHDQNECG